MDCIFCKIVAGELPSYKIYEDNDTMAFLDISPINFGHTLVIPKKHFENMESMDEETWIKLAMTVKKVGLAVKNGLGVDGYNINENNGVVAGQVVMHIHFHIIPRTDGDGLGLWPHGTYGDGEAQEAINRIKSAL